MSKETRHHSMLSSLDQGQLPEGGGGGGVLSLEKGTNGGPTVVELELLRDNIAKKKRKREGGGGGGVQSLKMPTGSYQICLH